MAEKVKSIITNILLVCAVISITLVCRAQTESERMPVSGVVPVHYDLKFTPNYKKSTLRATCSIMLRNNINKPVREIPFMLYRLLKVDSVSSVDGARMSFKQQVQSIKGFERQQVNVIRVRLHEPLAPGQTSSVRLSYEGYLLGYAETGMRYIQDRVDHKFTVLREDSLAYPVPLCPNEQDYRNIIREKFTYEAQVTVPDNLVVANGGELTGKDTVGKNVTFIYRSIKPSWRIDITISDYGMMEHDLNRIYYFKEDRQGAVRIMHAMNQAMELYLKWFGPLPADSGLALIEIPDGWGSQTDVTTIIQTAAAFQKKDSMYEFYHELSHRWNVTEMDPSPSRFEHEGLAMFLQALLQEKLEGKEHAVEEAVLRSNTYFQRYCKHDNRYADISMNRYGVEDATRLSYSKGMVFFALMYKLEGERAFFDMIKAFYYRYRESGATTDQFVSSCMANSKIDLHPLFKDWVYTSRSSKYMQENWDLNRLVKHYQSLKDREGVITG